MNTAITPSTLAAASAVFVNAPVVISKATLFIHC
jgi:hypothetical protein